MGNIFASAYNYETKADVFPFDDEQYDEYVAWRESANEKEFKDIGYKPSLIPKISF